MLKEEDFVVYRRNFNLSDDNLVVVGGGSCSSQNSRSNSGKKVECRKSQRIMEQQRKRKNHNTLLGTTEKKKRLLAAVASTTSLLDLPVELIDCISKFLSVPDYFRFRCLTSARLYRPLEWYPDISSVLFLAVLHGADQVFERQYKKRGSFIDMNFAGDKLLKGICCWSRQNMLKLLLEDDRLDPSLEHNVAIRIAAARRDADLISILLGDQRVDPTDPSRDPFGGGPNALLREEDINALMCAIVHCDVPVMKLFLQDKRVDPKAYRNFALHAACHFGRTDMIALILADGRVDPSEHEIAAVRSAVSQGHYNATELLLADHRVIQAARETPHTIRSIAALAKSGKHGRIALLLERWLRSLLRQR